MMLEAYTYINLIVIKEYTKDDFMLYFKESCMNDFFIVPMLSFKQKGNTTYVVASYTLNQSAN